MKPLLTVTSFVFLIFTSFSSFSQIVKLQNGFVNLDGKKIMTYQKRNMGNEISFYDLNTKEETIFLITLDKPNVYCNDEKRYTRIVFPTLNKSFDTSRVSFNTPMIKWLLSNGVIDDSGTINPEKVDILILKYDEHLSLN